MSGEGLIIVGAGPGGLSAARAAVSLGLRATLIDENPRPGGQYYRHAATPELRAIAADVFDEHESGRDLLDIARDPLVTFLPASTVIGMVEDGVIAVANGGSLHRFRLGCLVVATGATERPAPFPGWTLPGVMGAGAAQNLMKTQRVVPGGRILICGNGPLSLLAASNLVRLGANVVAVLEAARARPRLADLPALLLEPGILARGVGYQLRLRRRGLAVRRAMTIIAARGRERVEHAVIAPIAEDGAIDRARAETLAVDTVIAGFGLQPASELTRNIGCRHCYDAAKGGWIPERSDELETSIANVFAVGECAGAGGMEKAALEGALAGTIAATRLGAKAGTLALKRRLARLMRFRAAIERIYAPPASWLAMLTPETIVCRCEEVTAATLQAEIADGLTHVDSLKACTRASMGRCQGRNCLATVAAMIAAAEGRMPADIALPRARAPVKPVPVGVVAAPELLGTGDG